MVINVNELGADTQRDDRSSIIIAGQEFLVSNPIAIDPVSDFAQGIKTGSASYDQRLHAFFIAVNDYTGGIGYREADIREDVGVYATSTLGVDTRRSHRIQAPPFLHKVFSVSNKIVDAAWSQNRNASTNANSILKYQSLFSIGIPGAVLYSSDGIRFQRDGISDDDHTKLINAFFGDAGRGYFIYQEGAAYSVKAAGIRSTSGTNFGSPLDDFTMLDIWYSQAFQKFMQLSDTNMVGTTAYPIADLSAGNLPAGQGQIFGEMQSPFDGQVGIYFSKAGRLFFYTENAGAVNTWIVESIIGSGFNIGGGAYYNGQLYLHDGSAVKSYGVSGNQEIVRDIGFQEFRNTPTIFEGGAIRAMTADEAHLYVAMQVGSNVYIVAFNGRGWHNLGKISDFYIQNMDIARSPPAQWPAIKRSMYLVGADVSDMQMILRPTGDGNYTNWINGDYTAVNEIINDGNTTYQRSQAADRNSYVQNGIDDFGKTIAQVSNRPIQSIKITAICREHTSSTTGLLFFRIASTDYDSTTFSVSSSNYKTFTKTWTTNPATSNPWVAADLTGLEFGIKREGANEIRVTQIYITITFDGNFEVHEMHLPLTGALPVPGVDRFSSSWDLYTSWMDGGFIDLEGTLYKFIANGSFTNTEYVDVYYMIDGSDTEVLLGRINEDGKNLFWGTIHNEGLKFRKFRLRFIGFARSANIDITGNLYVGGVFQGADQELGDHDDRTQIAQSFTPAATVAASGVLLLVKKVASPTDSISVSIQASSGGDPDGVDIVSSTSYSSSDIDTEYGWRYFEFATSVNLTAATKYWMVVKRTGSISGTNYYRLRRRNNDAAYPDHEIESYDTVNWNELNDDLFFKIEFQKTTTAYITGFVVPYNKRPPYRSQFPIQVDVEGMIHRGILVDGEPATFESVYKKCVEFWDSRELLAYRIPGIRDGLCLVASMPVIVDNVGPHRDPSGTLTLQLIEPTDSRL
jgi:hypothetical protein